MRVQIQVSNETHMKIAELQARTNADTPQQVVDNALTVYQRELDSRTQEAHPDEATSQSLAGEEGGSVDG